MNFLWLSGTLLLSYLVGSIPFGLIAGRVLKGVDIREHGSRNIGATNAARVIGWKWFPVVLALDALKGAGPCLAGMLLMHHTVHDLALVAAFGALMGHFYSVYLAFKGGKGVATGLGIVLVLTWLPEYGMPLPALSALGVFAVILLFARIVSVASLVSALSIPIWYAVWLGDSLWTSPFDMRFIFLCVVAVAVVVKHRSNIRRIMAGEEPRLGRKRERHG